MARITKPEDEQTPPADVDPAAADQQPPAADQNPDPEEKGDADAEAIAPALTTIRMKVKISGTRDGLDWPRPGETIDVPEGEAVDLIANGYATHADAEETATAETASVETATPAGKRSIKANAEKADGGE